MRDQGCVQGGCVGDERDNGNILRGDVLGLRPGGAVGFRQQVFNAEQLRGEDTVERGEAEPALAVDEVGEMRLAEASLPSEKRAGQLPAVDAARYFHA